MTTPQVPKEYYRYLHELQTMDFVCLELSLYLDTHPDDQQAIGQFNQFQRRKQVLSQQFEANFGPLKEYGNSPVGHRWTWSAGPWPWQV